MTLPKTVYPHLHCPSGGMNIISKQATPVIRLLMMRVLRRPHFDSENNNTHIHGNPKTELQYEVIKQIVAMVKLLSTMGLAFRGLRDLFIN